MRNTRKGFTLIELLIVITILAVLTAAMTASVTGSTGKAKATAIANNIETCKSVAALCVAKGGPLPSDVKSINEAKTTDVLKAGMPTWAGFVGDTNATTKYAAVDTTAGADNWAITVDFSGEPDSADIVTALKNIKGYSHYYADDKSATAATEINYTTAKGKIKITLMSGKIEPATE